jgi:hypothetical protein
LFSCTQRPPFGGCSVILQSCGGTKFDSAARLPISWRAF